MNEYAKEGKRFLKSLDDYFEEFKEVVGHGMFFYRENRCNRI